MTTTELPVPHDLKGQLRVICAACQHEFPIRPSMAMLSGNNNGFASCPKCFQSLHCSATSGETAVSEIWETWLERTTAEDTP